MPALAPVVDSIDKVPEAARSFYEQKDGKFVLSIDGVPPGFAKAEDLAAANAKVVEFRTNNIGLTKEVEELRPLKDRYKDIDPDKAREALDKVSKLEKKGVKDENDVQTLISAAVAAAMKPVSEQLTALTQENRETKEKNQELTLRTKISDAFSKAGGKSAAIDFVLGLAKSVFEVKGGEVSPKATSFSASNPAQLTTVEEWVSGLQKSHDFVFEPSKGGGSSGSGSGSGSGNRTGQEVLRNPTPQQLGDPEVGKKIKAGKLRIEYDTAAQ